MTTITIPKALLEQALASMVRAELVYGQPNQAIQEAIRAELAKPVEPPYTYASTQATTCACCGKYKHTPLRIDAMDGYVCLTCIDQKLGSLLGEFGYPEPTPAWHDAPEAIALKAERDAAIKDAERYRWLRENGDAGCTMKDGYGGQELKTNGYLDAAVDEAIAKAEEKNHDRP